MKSYNLTDDELVILDGKCRKELQLEVDSAKTRIAARDEFPGLSHTEAAFIAKLVEEAEKNGKLIFRFTSIRHCNVCGKNAGYAQYTRRTKYHDKGSINYDKPLYMNGIEFADRFVTMQGYTSVGCCAKCWEKIQPLAAERLLSVRAQISQQIIGRPSRFTYHKNKVCQCGWRGHEEQMVRRPTLMGNGTYPAKCPECGAENNLFSTYIKNDEGFTLEENKNS